MTEKYKTNNLELNTKKKLFNKAVSYLAKFETTTGKLKLILEKFASNNLPGVSHKIISHQISEVVLKCEKLNYVSDENFLENKIVYFLKKGLSLKVIENRLREFQIDAEKYKKVLHSFYEDDKNLELKSAIYLAKKKRIGPYSYKEDNKENIKLFQSWMGIFSRAGFNYDISKRVLSSQNIEDLENILSNFEK